VFCFNAKKIIGLVYDAEGAEEKKDMMELDERFQDGWMSRLRETNQNENQPQLRC
jgi:hypothetical protein